ncbi:hypothetical protein KFK09_023151 [Dendrobium nobile]|uniref:DUF4283 domain-containing protein n=1 Tax=Dendrobium nobile TaxID=94219 RepID=A0A8T3AKP0_DENNO|nr:hypothetical protein KFK09_023151 [Dendrobium nobile]
MRLLKWSPDFDVREESPIAPVWIAFPNLRLHFFNMHILFGMASVFGRPLQTDQANVSLFRPSMARVFVEIVASKKHPHEIWLGSKLNGYFQKVEIENLPIFFSHYKMHGHMFNECFRLHPNLRKEKVSSKSNLGGDDVTLVQKEVGNGSNDTVDHNGDQVVEVPLAKDLEENLINIATLINVPNHDKNSIISTINENVNNVPDFSSNIAPNLCTMVIKDDGSSNRDPSPLEQEMWQNALPVDSTGNLEVVLDLGDIDSSKENDPNLLMILLLCEVILFCRRKIYPLLLLNLFVIRIAVKVNFFFSDNGWDLEKLTDVLPASIVQLILKIPLNFTSSIREFLVSLNCSVPTILEVGNACTQALAKLGCNWPNIIEFSLQQLPIPIQGLIRLDQIGLPYVNH